MENVVESGGQPVGWSCVVQFVLVAFEEEFGGADGKASPAVVPLSGEPAVLEMVLGVDVGVVGGPARVVWG